MEAPGAERMLPEAIARRLHDVPLPARLARSCGLPARALVGDLARPVRPRDGTARAALRLFTDRFVKSHRAEIADVRIFPQDASLDAATVQAAPWPLRTWNTLIRQGLRMDPRSLARLTYGELLRMQGVGVRSLMELGIVAEALHSPWVEATREVLGTVHGSALALLKNLATADWAARITPADPRFPHLIPDGAASLAALAQALLERLDESGRPRVSALSVPRTPAGAPMSLAAWLEAIGSRVTRLQSLTLEDALADLFDVWIGLKGRRRDAMLARLGWTGVPHTLADAARLLSVTRARIGQLEARVRQKLPATPTYVPALARALEALAEAAPIELDRAAVLLRQLGIARTPFAPMCVIAAAADLHLQARITITDTQGVTLLMRSTAESHIAAILASARQKAAAAGAVCAEDVAAEVSRSAATECSAEEVRRTLLAAPHLRPLGGSWFWVTDLGRHRLLDVCSSILSVCSPIAVSQIWEGMQRRCAYFNVTRARPAARVPPLGIVRAFLKDHPDFRVDDDDRVSSARPLDYRAQLRAAERTIVQLLRSAPGGVLDRASIIRECVKQGFKPVTVRTELGSSAVLDPVAEHVWAVRGSHIDPAAVQRCKPPQRRVRRPRRTPRPVRV